MTCDHERVWSERAAAAEARVEQLEAQVAGLERMDTEKAAVIRRLRMGNHPAGRALRVEPTEASLLASVNDISERWAAATATDLREACEERDAGHDGGAP